MTQMNDPTEQGGQKVLADAAYRFQVEVVVGASSGMVHSDQTGVATGA
jgi:hypothetical protein